MNFTAYVRTLARFICATLVVAVLSACTGTTQPTPSKAPTPRPTTAQVGGGPPLATAPPQGVGGAVASPTCKPTVAFTDTARTLAVPSGPTLEGLPSESLRFAEAAPILIGRWELNKNKSYVDKQGRGAVLYYSAVGVGEVQISLFVSYNDILPDYNTSNSIERFDRETSLIKVPKIPVAIGDKAIIAPSNRQPPNAEGLNPTVLAEMQWRNTVTIVYATSELLKSQFTISEDELKTFLQKMYEALPKPAAGDKPKRPC